MLLFSDKIDKIHCKRTQWQESPVQLSLNKINKNEKPKKVVLLWKLIPASTQRLTSFSMASYVHAVLTRVSISVVSCTIKG